MTDLELEQETKRRFRDKLQRAQSEAVGYLRSVMNNTAAGMSYDPDTRVLAASALLAGTSVDVVTAIVEGD